MLLIVVLVLWLLVKVKVFAAVVVPTGTVPKNRALGENATAVMPVPERFTICGLLLALSVMVIAPLTTPTTLGANFTLIEQLFCGANGLGQLLVWE